MSKDKEYDDYCTKAGIPNRNKAWYMNPRKHAELIHAWADGAEIEIRRSADAPWEKTETPKWYSDFEYRIKPERKPDIVHSFEVTEGGSVWHSLTNDREGWFNQTKANIRLTFDGETGKIKSAEVL